MILLTLALILAVLLQVVAGALPAATELGGVPITAVLGLAGVPLVVALVLFALATVGVASGRVNLVAAGLFCWLLAALLGGSIA